MRVNESATMGWKMKYITMILVMTLVMLTVETFNALNYDTQKNIMVALNQAK